MNTSIKKYRLGIDLGATSLGWAIYDIESNKVVDLGVRIFGDGRDAKTKCVERREARGARRLVSRHTMKKEHLINALSDIGLFPTNEDEQQKLKNLNPYAKIRKYDDLPDDIKKIVKKACGNKEPKEKDKPEILNTLKKMPLYVLRAKALDAMLDHPYQIGRILIQLGQRRGYLSISNGKEDEEKTKDFDTANKHLTNKMKDLGAYTYGEYLCLDHINNSRNTIRLKKALNEKGAIKNEIAFPFRGDYEDEFDEIWKKQQEFYPELLNEDNKEKIKNILFFQRLLKEPEIGPCHFESKEKRIAKAHPLFQEFNIRQTINTVIDHIKKKNTSESALILEKRKDLSDALYDKAQNSDKELNQKEILSTVRAVLKLEENVEIDCSIESIPINSTEREIKKCSSEKLKEIWNELKTKGEEGNLIDARIEAKKNLNKYEENKIKEKIKEKYKLNEETVENFHQKLLKNCDTEEKIRSTIESMTSNELQDFWKNLDKKNRNEFISFVTHNYYYENFHCPINNREQETVESLLKRRTGLDPESANLLLELQFKDGYGNLSKKAIEKILVGLRKGEIYSEACKRAGYNHSEYEYEKRDALPYYGEILWEHCLGTKFNPRNTEERFGRINNATVHVALNQVRLVVNELIRTYGKPSEISIEYARDLKNSAKERKKIKIEQSNNQKENDEIKERLEARHKTVSDYNIEKYKI